MITPELEHALRSKYMQELATVKKPGAVDTCSPDEYEWRIREIVRCKKDIVYFAENYFRIVNLDKGLHVIKLYDVQKEFLRYLVENNKVVCCSGRQQGKCVFKDTKIKIRNKKTGEIQEIEIEKFYDLIKNRSK